MLMFTLKIKWVIKKQSWKIITGEAESKMNGFYIVVSSFKKRMHETLVKY